MLLNFFCFFLFFVCKKHQFCKKFLQKIKSKKYGSHMSYIFIQIIIVQVFIKFGARYGSGHTQPCNLRFTHKIRRRIPYSSVSCGTTPLLLHTLSVCLTAVLECVEYRASYLSFGLCVVCTQHANHHLPSFLMFQRGLWDLLEHVLWLSWGCH